MTLEEIRQAMAEHYADCNCWHCVAIRVLLCQLDGVPSNTGATTSNGES